MKILEIDYDAILCISKENLKPSQVNNYITLTPEGIVKFYNGKAELVNLKTKTILVYNLEDGYFYNIDNERHSIKRENSLPDIFFDRNGMRIFCQGKNGTYINGNQNGNQNNCIETKYLAYRGIWTGQANFFIGDGKLPRPAGDHSLTLNNESTVSSVKLIWSSGNIMIIGYQYSFSPATIVCSYLGRIGDGQCQLYTLSIEITNGIQYFEIQSSHPQLNNFNGSGFINISDGNYKVIANPNQNLFAVKTKDINQINIAQVNLSDSNSDLNILINYKIMVAIKPCNSGCNISKSFQIESELYNLCEPIKYGKSSQIITIYNLMGDHQLKTQLSSSFYMTFTKRCNYLLGLLINVYETNGRISSMLEISISDMIFSLTYSGN